jgi:hypothetical protein
LPCPTVYPWVTVASTEGNADVPGFDGFKIGLNVFKYSQ